MSILIALAACVTSVGSSLALIVNQVRFRGCTIGNNMQESTQSMQESTPAMPAREAARMEAVLDELTAR